MDNKTVVLCDLDGCFIDDRWRRHHCDWKNREFTKYHSLIPQDPRALPVMLEVLMRHKAAGHIIYFTTARPDSAFKDTINQIQKFIGWQVNKDYNLHMRQSYEEGVPSAALKSQMFNRIRECFVTGTIFYAYDDHGDVCQAYYDMGIQNVYLVNDRIAVDCGVNMASQICNKIRGGFSFECNMYRIDHLNHFYFYGAIPDLPPKEPLMHFLYELKGKCRLSGGTFHYEGEKEIAERMAANTEIARRAMNNYDMLQKPINIGHVSIDINRDEKVRNEELLKEVEEEWLSPDVANLPRILEMSAQTFSDRREIYGDSSDQFGRIMAILMENNNYAPSMAKEHEMYMFFNHIVGKLVRFSNSGFKHTDSIHDVINYAGLVECCVIGIDRDIKKAEGEGNESE